ncbi:MAG: HigA family addiction module antitoxin [Pseudomonadota bacterium]|nr:HigA family addiction module antitoxin [Pseudomonadota bacterium]
MAMYNPPHPGEFIESVYMEPYGVSCRTLAAHIGVAASTLNRIIKSKSAVTPEMALRLSRVLGRSPESWLSMQDNYDLFEARKKLTLNDLKPMAFDTASA